RASERDREECIDQPDRGGQRLGGIATLAQPIAQQSLRQLATHWPGLREGELALPTRRITDASHGFVDRKFALLDRGQLDLARLTEWHHDFVDEAAFLHGADSITGAQALANFAAGREAPLMLRVERGH